MAFYETRATGRTRTLVFEGFLHGEVGVGGRWYPTLNGNGQGPPVLIGTVRTGATAIYYLSDPFLGDQVLCSLTGLYAARFSQSGHFYMAVYGQLTLQMNFGSQVYSITSSQVELARTQWPETVSGGPVDVEVHAAVDATFRVEIDVDEYRTVDFFNPGSLPWPPVTPDGPPQTWLSYFENVRIGTGVIRGSITSGAIGTLSHSFDNADAYAIGYQTALRATSNPDGSGARADGTATANGDLSGIALTRNYSESGNGNRTYNRFYGTPEFQVGTFPYTWSVNTAGGAYVHATGACGGNSTTPFSSVELDSQPRWQISFSGTVKKFDGSAYLGLLTVRIYADGIWDSQNFVGGSFSHQITREIWIILVNGAYRGSGGGADLRAFAYIDAATLYALNEEPDTRLLAEGRSWNAITIQHNSNLLVDDCSSGSLWTAGSNTTKTATASTIQLSASGGQGSGTGTYSPKKVSEAYRYLDVRFRSTVNDNQTFRFQLGQKYWDLVSDVSGTYVTRSIDLCAPDGYSQNNLTQQDSRWPITSYTSISVLDNTPVNEASNWGVNAISTIQVRNIPDGETVELDSFTLARKNYSKLHIASTFSSAGDQGYASYILPAGPHTIVAKRHVLGNTDGRQSLEAMDCFIADGLWTPVNINYLATELGRIPGWSVTNLAPGDPYFNHSNMWAYYVGAGGQSRGDDYLEWDSTAARTLKAYFLFDVISPYPGQNDADGGADTSGNPLNLLYVPKIMRGSGHGITVDANLKPISGANMEIRENPPGTVSAGTATSDSGGYFNTGIPFARGNHMANFLSDGTVVGSAIMINRKKSRLTSRVSIAGDVHTATDPSSEYCYDLLVDVQGIRLLRYDASITDITQWNVLSQQGIHSGQVAVLPDTRILVVYSDGTNIYSTFSDSKGSSWQAPTQILSGTNPSVFVDFKNRTIYIAFHDGSAWKLARALAQTEADPLSWVILSTISTDPAGAAALSVHEDPVKYLTFTVGDGAGSPGNVKRWLSTTAGDSWVGGSSVFVGKSPNSYQDERNGDQFMAFFTGSTWRCGRFRPTGLAMLGTWEDVGEISTLGDGRCGFVQVNDASRSLLFVKNDGSNIRRFRSTNRGESFVEV